MHSYAQTNVQLFNQLRSEGYSEKEEVFIWDVYQFAMRIFAGQYLPSGKPFIDHFIGTASILASLQLPVEVVVAGLIHAAYRYGDFGEVRSGVSQSKRNQVVDIVGEKIEAYLARYENRNWNSPNLAILYDRLDDLSSLDRDVLLIRLASELERCLDLGELYFPDNQRRRAAQQRFIESVAPLWVKTAGRLGFASLSADMKTVFEEMGALKEVVGPRIQTRHQGAFLVRPESQCERLGIGIWRRLDRGYRLIYRIPNRAKRFCKKALGAWRGTEDRLNGKSARPQSRWQSPLSGKRSKNGDIRMKSLRFSAQTFPQLFNQLREQGYSNADRTLIRDAYGLAMVLFSARFQPSGKVFMAHVVGTASILASLQQPASAIAAGLLHNVYQGGDFGDGERGLKPRRRTRIRRVIGEEAEQYIARFLAFSWQSHAVQLALNDPQDVNPADRTVLLIRIADLLEHLGDLDLLYYPEEIRRRYLHNCKPASEMAHRLGFVCLAAELEEKRQKTEAGILSVAVPGKRTTSTAFCLVPKSQRQRCAMILREIWKTRRSGLRRRIVRPTKSLPRSARQSTASIQARLARPTGLYRSGAWADGLNERSEEFRSLFCDGERLERVATGFQFTEGPVWIKEKNRLLFSDIPANRIYELAAHGQITTFREPSGNSNGLTRDREGRLIACEHGNQRVTRTEADGSITVPAETFGGKRLNSPNDVVVKSDGAIYFTDPAYGISPGEQEQQIEGVYRLSPDGRELSLVADDFARPNGLAFSPDERNLYIDDSKRRHIRVFTVEADGSLSGGAVFHDMNVSTRGSPDGMKVDVDGRVYCAGARGVWVFDKRGAHMGTIVTPEKPSNCAWGGEDWRTLYITACKSVYSIRVNRPGIGLQ